MATPARRPHPEGPGKYTDDVTTREITVLDLFAGAGGLTAGLHQASDRFHVVGAVEWDQAAAASYEATYGPGIVYAGDIKGWLEKGEVRART